MQTIIESFSDLRVGEYGPSAKIKTAEGKFMYVNEDPTNLVGKTVDIEVTNKTSQKTGRQYVIGKILKVYEATAANNNSNGNGKITWDDYRAMAEAAHELAAKLEPDEISEEGADGEQRVRTDRGAVRAAIMNTCLIAYANGKIFVPEDDDDQIPPF